MEWRGVLFIDILSYPSISLSVSLDSLLHHLSLCQSPLTVHVWMSSRLSLFSCIFPSDLDETWGGFLGLGRGGGGAYKQKFTVWFVWAAVSRLFFRFETWNLGRSEEVLSRSHNYSYSSTCIDESSAEIRATIVLTSVSLLTSEMV